MLIKLSDVMKYIIIGGLRSDEQLLGFIIS
jgi:hypothetical protein